MRLFYENIHVRLGGKEILKGVDLCTEEGKVTGIIGPNGCGKSTLIKTTFGLVKPVQGRILVGAGSLCHPPQGNGFPHRLCGSGYRLRL